MRMGSSRLKGSTAGDELEEHGLLGDRFGAGGEGRHLVRA
jgi:hypothetical protein